MTHEAIGRSAQRVWESRPLGADSVGGFAQPRQQSRISRRAPPPTDDQGEVKRYQISSGEAVHDGDEADWEQDATTGAVGSPSPLCNSPLMRGKEGTRRDKRSEPNR